MTAFPEWGDVAKDPLVLPIQGVKYTIPPLGYLDEIELRSLQDQTRKTVDGDEDAPPPKTMTDDEFLSKVLGGALVEMRANNVPPIAIAHAAAVAHTDATIGREVALYIWERGLDPKALAADMATIRKAVSRVADQRGAPKAPKPAKKTARKRAARSTS